MRVKDFALNFIHEIEFINSIKFSTNHIMSSSSHVKKTIMIS